MSIFPEGTDAVNEPLPFDSPPSLVDAHEGDPGSLSASPGRHDHVAAPLRHVYGDVDAPTAWILVGLSQAHAAAECEPDGVVVYCIDDGGYSAAATPEGLDVIEGKRVVIFPKGDAATDHVVFDRSTKFGRMCADEGAEVEFAWLGTDLHVHLGSRSLEQRKRRLERAATRTGTKPAKAKPPAPSKSEQNRKNARVEIETVARAAGRAVIDVSEDRQFVLDRLVLALQEGRDGGRLFNFGGKLACLEVNDETGATEARLVDDEALLNLLPRCAQMITATTNSVHAAWPESKTVTALYGRSRDFRPLRGIAPSPIVRGDNSIAAEAGYDEASQTLLDLDGLEIDIPDDPSADEVAAAVSLLLDEWLGDFPFQTPADKANALALILTYPVRELVDLVPLAIISAKSKGTGKSKLLALIVYLFTRAMPAWDSLPSTEEETRKQITTLLSTASPFIGFDESPVVGGKSINRLLTARMWSDRVLGGNQRATLPNRAVMASTGNNVQVLGDTGRRYYPIELFYDGEDPENRPESDFQHPDIETWTAEHRAELLTAVFTLIRAWQMAGRPKKSTSFGSFERWEAIIGGVLLTAGVEGFLDNLRSHRESADYDEGLWAAHCAWLSETFTKGRFTTSDVVKLLVHHSGNHRYVNAAADLPPWLELSPVDAGYPAALGRLYNERHDCWFGGYRIRKADGKTDNKVTWIIEVSPRLLQEKADADAAAALQVRAAEESERAARFAGERERAARMLPELKARLAEMVAEQGNESGSIEMKILRLEIENAQFITSSAGVAPSATI